MISKHRLVLIYGPGSGFGKSTLGQALTEALLKEIDDVVFYEEHDVSKMPVFQDYVAKVESGAGDDTDSLLACCTAFLSGLTNNQSQIVVMDSTLPCWDWLFSAGCSEQVVGAFTRKLCSQLAVLNPFLVIVEGDLETALARAIGDRSEEWGLNLAEARMGNRNLDLLLEYFCMLRKGMEAVLPVWEYKMMRVDTVDQAIEKSVKNILDVL